VDSDPHNAGSLLTDILQKMPMITVDMDRNVKLKGKSNYKVLVNGRVNSFFTHNPGEALRAFPVGAIARIEIITAPGARYDGEAADAIINIVLRRKVEGYSGSINGGLNTLKQHNQDAFFMLKRNKLGFILSGSNQSYNTPFTASFEQIHPTAPFQKELRHGSGILLNVFRVGYIEISAEPDTFNIFNLNISGVSPTFGSVERLLHSGVNPAGETIESGVFTSKSQNKILRADAGFDYIRKFKKPEQELSLSLAHSRSDSRRISYDLRYFETGTDNTETNSNEQEIELEQIAELNYQQPIKGGNQMLMGAKLISRQLDNQFFQKFESDDNTLPAVSDGHFIYMQRVMSSYGQYDYNLKKLSVKPGLRYEYTTDQFEQTRPKEYSHQYGILLPSLSMQLQTGAQQAVQMSFARKIQRAGLYYLSPFLSLGNPRSTFSGNPYLLPMITKNASLSWNYTGTKRNFNITLEYAYADKVINDIRITDTALNIVHTTFANTGTRNTTAISIFYRETFHKKWTLSLNSRLAFEQLTGLVSNNHTSNSGMVGQGNMQIRGSLGKGWSIQGYAGFDMGRLQLQGRDNLRYNYNFGLSKSLTQNKKLRLNLSIHQPFEKFRREYNVASDPYFYVLQQTNYQVRAINLRCSWAFGKLKKNVSTKRGTQSEDKL
jgi:ferric enterobactin receptor